MNNKENQNIEETKPKKKIFRTIGKIIVIIFAIIGLISTIDFCIKLYEEIRWHSSGEGMIDKPVIYIYPEEETDVEIKLLNEQNITVSYPKYKDSWNVTAYSNGDLIDNKTGNKLYSLYYENINILNNKMNLEEGFVVKAEEITDFLEEKLDIIGLNYKEKEEFIIYWLPKFQEHKYIYLRFQTMEEINTNMPLEITPQPDSLIRIIMEWKGLDEYIEVKEQELSSPERKGYTIVEWGATILE